MEDVARAAGVNKATVSRALKGDSRISSATREKVWNTAKELGYRLDLTASGLSGGRTGLVAIVLGSLKPWFCPLFFSGVNRVLTKSGLDFLLKMPGFNRNALSGSLMSRRVDCILLAGNGEEDAHTPALFLEIPTVTAGFRIDGLPAVLVSEQETVSRLRLIASGRPLRLASGPSPLFPFLAENIAAETPDTEDAFWIFDDCAPETENFPSGCLCALPGDPGREGFFRLEWPAFEMGVTAGRLLLKALAGKEAFSACFMPVPLLRDPSGEKLLFEKMN